MLHVEAKTGKSYPIINMTEEHLLKTLELFLSRCEKMIISKDNNPRFISDIESTFNILSSYYFVGEMEGIINPIFKQRFENVYDSYKRTRKAIFIEY